MPILGSIRIIRDFIEGPSLLYPEFQDSIDCSDNGDGRVALSRMWLDNVTTSTLSFQPVTENASVSLEGNMVNFTAGTYMFNASFNYPQLTQLGPSEVLNEESQHLIEESPVQVNSLSFLSYTDKLMAGGWRFLTYFGRDDIISMLLMENILSTTSPSCE